MLRIFFVVVSGPLQSNVLIMGLYSGALDICTAWWARIGSQKTKENGKKNEKSRDDVTRELNAKALMNIALILSIFSVFFLLTKL